MCSNGDSGKIRQWLLLGAWILMLCAASGSAPSPPSQQLPTGAQDLQVDTLTVVGSYEGCGVLVSEGTLGDPGTPLPFAQPRIDVASDGGFRLVDLQIGVQEGVAILTASAELQGRLGTRGDGPGELRKT